MDVGGSSCWTREMVHVKMESIPPDNDDPAGFNWEFKTWGIPGADEYDGEFGDEPATRPALRCNGRGALVGCGETMLRDHHLALVLEVDDDKSAAVLDARENVLGNDKGGAFSVIVIYSFI
jgi:hypothetical protein